MFSTSDTIVAVATPAGRGGIGVVRICGPDAERLARELTGHPAPFPPRTATFCYVGVRPRNSANRYLGVRSEIRDQVVVTFFAAPSSYTGEDVIEISAHGSPIVLAA